MLSFESNDFIVASAREQRVEHAKVAASTTGDLERGTLLANDGDGTFSIAGASNIDDAEVILAEIIKQVGEAQDVVAPVYVSGDFRKAGLLTGSSTAITPAAMTNLKNAGIYLVDGVES